jgi:chromosome segregation ATPase
MSKEAIIDALGKVEGLEGKEDLVKEVESTYDAAGAKEKVQEANKDLTTQRETWESEKKDLKGQIGTLESKIKTLEGGGDNKTAELQAQLDKAKGELEALTNRMDTEKAEAQKAKRDAKVNELKSSIVGVAGSDKGKAVNPNQVYALMEAEGLVSLNDKNEPIYNRIKDGKTETATAEEAVLSFLEANPHLVASSGKQGSGEGAKGTQSTGAEFVADDHLTDPKLR